MKNSQFLYINRVLHSTFLDSSCFLEDKYADSSARVAGVSVGYVSNIESAIACQEKCQEESQCQTFVYKSTIKRCLFKNRHLNEAEIRSSDNVISGPKYCSE